MEYKKGDILADRELLFLVLNPFPEIKSELRIFRCCVACWHKETGKFVDCDYVWLCKETRKLACYGDIDKLN